MEQNEVLKALQRNHAAELKLAAERLEGTARHTEIIPFASEPDPNFWANVYPGI